MSTNYTNNSVPNFTVLATALATAKAHAGVTGTTDDTALTELLQLSAGVTATNATPASAVLYRPYEVAATWLERKVSQLVSGDGATFRRPGQEIARLRRWQAQVDATQQASVPSAFQAGPSVSWGP